MDMEISAWEPLQVEFALQLGVELLASGCAGFRSGIPSSWDGSPPLRGQPIGHGHAHFARVHPRIRVHALEARGQAETMRFAGITVVVTFPAFDILFVFSVYDSIEPGWCMVSGNGLFLFAC